jgi:hypothetical protein
VERLEEQLREAKARLAQQRQAAGDAAQSPAQNGERARRERR